MSARRGQNRPDARGVIELTTKTNPRKPGTVQHARFSALMRFAGKTAQEFYDSKAAESSPSDLRLALEYAIKTGHARLT